MNDSVLEKEKTAKAVSSVENTENEKGVVTLSNGDKVDKATGEITKEGKKDDSVSINSNPDTETTTTNGSETKANLPTTTTPNKEEATAPTLSDEEKENQMRNEVNALDLKNLDVKLMYEMMSVPTYSNYEYRMVTWLILWARKHNIEHKFDDYGNLYFIKGKPADGHFYPCVTAHLDTVQNKAKAYILTGAELDLKTRVNSSGEHEVYIDGMGTGSDDKNAILIALHMFEKFDTLKGAFYLGEEVGCKGSRNMDVKFFDDVSYVIGFDSPELNRAAWRLMGSIKMFTADFYKKHMKPICDKYGMTKFYSESVTDEAYITEKTGLMTMNFGNGGYNAHATNEYFIVEELDHALSMGIELVETIPTDVQHKVKSFTWEKDPITGQMRKSEVDSKDDEEYLASLGDSDRYYSYRNYGTTYYGSSSNSSSSSTNRSDGYWNKDKKNDDTTKEDGVNEETVQYIADTYEERIEEIKDAVESKCNELGLDFKKTFAAVFSKEIKF